MMDVDNSSSCLIPSTISQLSHEDICQNATILDDGIRLCPICRSEVRLFFINFNEKVLMCENIDCDYPFGHENVIYLKEDNETQFDEEVASFRSKSAVVSPSATCSVISTAAWSEIDRMNKIYEDEDHVGFNIMKNMKDKTAKKKKMEHEKLEKESQKKLLQDIEEVNKLSNQLIHIHNDDDKLEIKNKKWIKTLIMKQKSSNVSLVMPEEMKLLKKCSQSDLGLGELKIDIGIGDNSTISSIKIEIANKNTNSLDIQDAARNVEEVAEST